MKWSKQKLIYLFFCIAALFIGTACSKDNDDDSPYAEDRFDRALYYKYPNAMHVEWKEISTYQVAECLVNGYKKEVWFDVSTHWVMTVTQIDPTELPNGIIKAIAEGEFSSWHIGQVDLLEFSGKDRVYVLRMRSGGTDLHLYYGPQGELFKITDDTADDYWPGMAI